MVTGLTSVVNGEPPIIGFQLGSTDTATVPESPLGRASSSS